MRHLRVLFLLAGAALAHEQAPSRTWDHGWGMALGTGFDTVPVVIDVHHTFSLGVGLYLGGGGIPHPRDGGDWRFGLNLNDKGTLRRTSRAGHLGMAVTRFRGWGFGLGFGRLERGWEVERGGWFTAEEMARLDSTEVRKGPHAWAAYYPNRILGFQVQTGPGWGGVSLALRFYGWY